MSQTTRTILSILTITITALAAAGIPGAPAWAEVVLAALAAGFGAVGIVPPHLMTRTDIRNGPPISRAEASARAQVFSPPRRQNGGSR